MSTAKTKRTNRETLIRLSQYALLTALIIVMTATPIGYISYGALSITLIHIPVIIAAIILGPVGGTAMGAVWGITCLIKAFLAPPTPLEGIIFQSPVVSILPRVLVGLAAGLIFRAFVHGTERKRRIGAGVAALGGSLTNTVATLGLIYLLFHSEMGLGSLTSIAGLGKFIGAAFALNAPVEIAAAVVLTVPVSIAVRKALEKQRL